MVGSNSSSFINGGSFGIAVIIIIITTLLQAHLQVNVVVVAITSTEDYQYHLVRDENKRDNDQHVTAVPRRRRKRRITASNNNNDDCAWHADMITRDGCTNDDNCKFS